MAIRYGKTKPFLSPTRALLVVLLSVFLIVFMLWNPAPERVTLRPIQTSLWATLTSPFGVFRGTYNNEAGILPYYEKDQTKEEERISPDLTINSFQELLAASQRLAVLGSCASDDVACDAFLVGNPLYTSIMNYLHRNDLTLGEFETVFPQLTEYWLAHTAVKAYGLRDGVLPSELIALLNAHPSSDVVWDAVAPLLVNNTSPAALETMIALARRAPLGAQYRFQQEIAWLYNHGDAEDMALLRSLAYELPCCALLEEFVSRGGPSPDELRSIYAKTESDGVDPYEALTLRRAAARQMLAQGIFPAPPRLTALYSAMFSLDIRGADTLLQAQPLRPEESLEVLRTVKHTFGQREILILPVLQQLYISAPHVADEYVHTQMKFFGDGRIGYLRCVHSESDAYC